MRHVIIHIESVYVRDIAAGDTRAFVAGLRREISRMLAEPSQARNLARAAAPPSLKVRKYVVGHPGKPAAFGAASARAIVNGILR